MPQVKGVTNDAIPLKRWKSHGHFRLCIPTCAFEYIPTENMGAMKPAEGGEQ